RLAVVDWLWLADLLSLVGQRARGRLQADGRAEPVAPGSGEGCAFFGLARSVVATEGTSTAACSVFGALARDHASVDDRVDGHDPAQEQEPQEGAGEEHQQPLTRLSVVDLPESRPEERQQ